MPQHVPEDAARADADARSERRKLDHAAAVVDADLRSVGRVDRHQRGARAPGRRQAAVRGHACAAGHVELGAKVRVVAEKVQVLGHRADVVERRVVQHERVQWHAAQSVEQGPPRPLQRWTRSRKAKGATRSAICVVNQALNPNVPGAAATTLPALAV